MKRLTLEKYGPIISDKVVGDEIFSFVSKEINLNDYIILNLSSIRSMATFNAKQIFGRLYLTLGSEVFFEKLRLENTSEDLKLIIQIGIQNALDDQTEKDQK